MLTFDNDELYIMMLIVRGKDNSGCKSEDIIIRRVVKNKYQCDSYLNELKAIGDSLVGLKYNIYITYNPRCMFKAYQYLKKVFANIDFYSLKGDEGHLKKLKKLDMEWVSSLQREGSCLRRNYYLIDLDDTNKLKEVRDFIFDKIGEELVIPTRNGWHFLVKPFDVRVFYDWKRETDINVELKQDAMLQIYYGGME